MNNVSKVEIEDIGNEIASCNILLPGIVVVVVEVRSLGGRQIRQRGAADQVSEAVDVEIVVGFELGLLMHCYIFYGYSLPKMSRIES